MPFGSIAHRSVWLCAVLWLWCAGPGLAQDKAERKALDLFQSGNVERAKTAFLKILATRPNDPVALYHLGRMEQDGTAARQYYLRLVQHAPQHPYADDALLAVARWQYLDGQYREAAQTCNRLLSSYPDTDVSDQARYWLGRALLAHQEPTLARLTFFQLLNVYPQSSLVMPARLGIADSFRAERAFTEAVKAYLKIEAEFPSSDSLRVALFRAGGCLEAAGKPDDARNVYKRLIARFPDSPEATAAQSRITTPAPATADAPKRLLPSMPLTPSSPASAPGFTLQVGTFKDRSRAEALQNRINHTGILTEIVVLTDKARKYYRVLAGRFTEADKAKAVANRLKQDKVITEYKVIRVP